MIKAIVVISQIHVVSSALLKARDANQIQSIRQHAGTPHTGLPQQRRLYKFRSDVTNATAASYA